MPPFLGPEGRTGPDAVVAFARIRFVQGPVDALWARTGVAWHVLGTHLYRLSMVLLVAFGAYAVLFGRLTSTYVVVGSLEFGGAYALSAHGARFSRAAARDPFLSGDPVYRAEPFCRVVSTFAVFTASCALGSAFVTLVSMVLLVCLGFVDGPVAVVVAANAILGFAFLSCALGVLVSGCTRPTRARTDAAREPEGARDALASPVS